MAVFRTAWLARHQPNWELHARAARVNVRTELPYCMPIQSSCKDDGNRTARATRARAGELHASTPHHETGESGTGLTVRGWLLGCGAGRRRGGRPGRRRLDGRWRGRQEKRQEGEARGRGGVEEQRRWLAYRPAAAEAGRGRAMDGCSPWRSRARGRIWRRRERISPEWRRPNRGAPAMAAVAWIPADMAWISWAGWEEEARAEGRRRS